MAPPEKTMADRVRETVTLLKKLKEVGIGATDPGYRQCKEYMDLWIREGKSASYTIEFPRHGRKGELNLPMRQGLPPSLNLRAPT